MFQPVPVFVGLRLLLAREHSFFVSFITWVSLLGVALGVAILIVVLSVMNGLGSELRDRLLSVSAHASLNAGGAAIPDWRLRIQQLTGAPELEGAAPYLDTDAMLSRQPAMSGAVVRGIDPGLETQVSTIADSMREGKLSDLTPGRNRIILGRMLAYQLEVGVGDTITVMTPGNGGAANGGPDQRSHEGGIVPVLREFYVSGIFEVGLQEHDSALALVNLEDAETLRGLAGPTGIRLKFDDVLKAPVLARAAAARIGPGLRLRDWTQDNEAYFRAIRIEKTMMALILMLIVAVAVFNIAATLVMVVSDKRTDIAILRTLGMSPRGVLAVFMTQGVLIGWIGTAIGVALGLAVALHVPFLEQALDLHIMDPDVYYISTIPSETRAGDVVSIALAALALTFAATIYPALQAAKTQPARGVAALRDEALLVRGDSWGWRYLRAAPRPGFVSLIAAIATIGLALGVAVLVVVLSVMNGFEEELRTRILSLTAHATISGLEGRLSDWRPQVDKLERFPGVAAAPYIEEQGMVTHAGKSAGILLRGVLPDAERRVADLTPHLLSGHLGDLLPGKYRVILGKDLAEELGAKVGDRVVVIVAQGDVTPVGVMPRMRAFEVAGIIAVGMYEYDRRIALVAMQDVAKLLRMGEDISGIRLNVTDMYAAPRVVRDSAAALGGSYLVEDWTTQHANFFRSIEITKRILFIMLSAVVAVAAFNIVSTMVMVVKSKRRDIAILRTFGSSPRSILSVFVVQEASSALLGIALLESSWAC